MNDRAADLMEMHRDRIYSRYNTGRMEELAPATLAGLEPRAYYLRALIRKHFPVEKNALLLDLGCGYGAMIHFANKEGYRNITGVDGSREQVLAAKRLGINGVSQGDIRKKLSEQAGQSLDAIIAFDVIEHFTREELIPFVDEVLRILKPNGRFIMHVPNGESPFCGRMRYWDMTHEMAFTRTSLGQLLLSSGFSKVNCFEDRPIVHGLKSAVRWIIWMAIRGSLRIYIAAETGDVGNAHIFSQNMLAVAIK